MNRTVEDVSSKPELFSKADLKKLIIPLIIEQTLVMTVGMFDSVMVSSLGDASVSGVSLVDMINNVIINIFAALATGGAVVVSQYIGAKKNADAQSTVKQLLMVNLMFSLAIMALLLAFRADIISVLFGKIEADVSEACNTYLWITALSFPFIAVYNACAALFRAIGNSKISMMSSFVSNILNIIGNAILIFGFNMGVAGAAYSTLFARFFAMIYLLYKLSKKGHVLSVNFSEPYRYNSHIVRKILYIGIPNSVENCLFQLGRILVVRIIATFGTVQIAANSVANTLDAVGCISGQAMNLAIITVVGQCVGMGDMKEVIRYFKRLMKIAYKLGAVCNLLVMLTLPLTLWMYKVSPEASHLAMILVLIHTGFAILLWPASFTLPSALRATNDVKFTMIVGVSSMLIVRILLSYYLATQFHLGAIGVWIAMVLDWAIRSLFSYLRFRSGKWQYYALNKAGK